MSTGFAKIGQLSAANEEMVFDQLMHHFDEESLQHCYRRLDRKAASGSDGVTKSQYGEQLGKNTADLVNRLKRMTYRPSAVMEVMIAKEGQKKASRPLGISNFEDKVVQKRFQEVLEAIYEPLFYNNSYGFRPRRSCHDAVKALHQHLYNHSTKVVIDLDLSNYFGSIDHEQLIRFLQKKISDRRFLRYIRRMLKCGILGDAGFRRSDEGVTQGSVCSPVLANIFAHYVLDDWFESTVKEHCREEVALFRYADDAVICCNSEKDAARIRKALESRLSKYGLALNQAKTSLVKFDKRDHRGSGGFDFLGFTFYVGLTRNGRPIPKLKSSGKKLRSKLLNVKLWCRRYRNEYRLSELWQRFCVKLRGHVQYYGVSFNGEAVDGFVKKSIFVFLKWINRRSQKRSMTYEQFKNYMSIYPPPKARIVHRLY